MTPPPNNHNDALVISASLNNYWVRKILINSGSPASIMLINYLVGFGCNTLHPVGEVELTLSLGTHPKIATNKLKFLVVDATSPYLAILGWHGLNWFQVIASTYNMKLKFPTPKEVGEVIGAQRATRECNSNTLRGVDRLESSNKICCTTRAMRNLSLISSSTRRLLLLCGDFFDIYFTILISSFLLWFRRWLFGSLWSDWSQYELCKVSTTAWVSELLYWIIFRRYNYAHWFSLPGKTWLLCSGMCLEFWVSTSKLSK